MSADSNRRIVELNNVQQNNIVLIDLSKTLIESVFEQEYRKAARIIHNIIMQQSEMKKESEWNRDYRIYQRRKGGRQNLTKCQTAVPFIGDRGTGKTSVMCSILGRLRNYEGGNKDAAFYLGSDVEDPRFVTFDMIDANTLKKTDDVMEIILSRMLTYLEDLQLDGDFRELYRQIDEIHEDLCLVHGDKERRREEYGLTSLQRIADSQNIIESFQKLVEEFNQLISVNKFHCHPCYLVIALDDIDMYRGSDAGLHDSQFALLEQIYKHMRIPGLIVLMTYNERILKRTCNRHFENIYFGDDKPSICSKVERDDIEALSGQFISKLFPQEQRIYMPDYMLINSADKSNLYVRPVLLKENRENLIEPFTAKKEIPVKEFMLRLIAHKTGVYFDATGSKKHFFEPRNLREFGELFQVINSLENVTEDPIVRATIQSRNRQELLNYLYNQFALRYLNTEEYEEFRKLSMLPLDRQNKTIVNQINQYREKVMNDSDSLGYLGNSKAVYFRYSYGELLRSIYFSTRIGNGTGGKDTLFSKEFVHCILGTRSIILNENVYGADSRKTMLPVIGASIAEHWANEMVPKLYHEDYTDLIRAGFLELPIRSYFGWEIPKEVQDAILGIYFGSSKKSEKTLYQFLEALVVSGMLFTSFPESGLGIMFDAHMKNKEEAALVLCSNSDDRVCFDVMNFVLNLYRALPVKDEPTAGYLDFMHEKLKKLGIELSKQLENDWHEKMEEANDFRDILIKDKEEAELGMPLGFSTKDRNVSVIDKVVDRASAWIALMNMYAESQVSDLGRSGPNYFVKRWNVILQNIISKYAGKITNWQREYESFRFVLPVQNFDMMYNILKRLADRSYHSIPKEAPSSKVLDGYTHLLKSIETELSNQDKVYFGDSSKGFAEAFKNSVFYQVIMLQENDKKYNPYLKYVMGEMIRSTAGGQQERHRRERFRVLYD